MGYGAAAIALMSAPAFAAEDINGRAGLSKSPQAWAGFYVGAHLGYAGGSSGWSATNAGLPSSAGSLSFYVPFDLFKGSGSFFGGLQGGYNYVFPSRLMIGVEADVSFPSTIASVQTVSFPSAGQASYGDTVLYSGTVRGRIGYAFDTWLFYGTAGFAWTYDQLTRTQIAGGTAAAGTVESALLWRLGWAAGAGVEFPIASHWTARLEYLRTDFANRGASFPAAAQRFDSNLTLQSVRLGLNYHLGEDTKKWNVFAPVPAALETNSFSIHAQTTYVNQYAFPFRSPYSGTNSFQPNIGRETWDATLYVGLRPWSGAEIWINPEIDQGFGLSGTLGVAGFTSGEAYKRGAEYPYTRVQRAFLRQTFELGGQTEKVQADLNQFAGSQTSDRLVFTVGKFGVGDIFDTNKYAHDPRSDFLNWAVIGAGTFDYAAEAWGYTLGAAAEWYQGPWTLRAGLFDLSVASNSTDLDPQFQQFQWIGEIERRYELWGQPGKLKATAFLSRARMGRYDDAIRLAQSTGMPADLDPVRRYTSRSGIHLNLEQQLSPDLGVFARAGMASGNVEPYELADIDRTLAAGLSLSGRKWGRPDDTFGLAGVINVITASHQAFFQAGGIGILVGDGQLPNPGAEKIVEAYYSFPLASWRATVDYQFITNPAYNRDRGPVSVVAGRLHAQF
jgi:high affinity Mn2+ porin